jgi:hypothetical protein
MVASCNNTCAQCPVEIEAEQRGNRERFTNQHSTRSESGGEGGIRTLNAYPKHVTC